MSGSVPYDRHATRRFRVPTGVQLLGNCSGIVRAREQIEEIVASGADPLPPVLVVGETGTGKDLVAQVIHQRSSRHANEFVDVNCAALPEHLVEAELFGHDAGAFTGAEHAKPGLFEAADKSTLFLDEIGEIALPIQAKLLKALEQREVRRVGGVKRIPIDVQIVTATNLELKSAVAGGDFRRDLYYRLNVCRIKLPPLRDRGDDVLILAKHFVARHGERYRKQDLQLSKEFERALLGWSWPGNVRELSNVIERAVLSARDGVLEVPGFESERGVVAKVDFDAAGMLAGLELPEAGINLEAVERAFLEQALEQKKGNVAAAARLLGISRETMRYRMKKFSIGRES